MKPPKRPSKRAITLGTLRSAGYHGDERSFVRAYVEGRVSITNANKAWRDGERMRAAGVRCTCFNCRAEKPASIEVAP